MFCIHAILLMLAAVSAGRVRMFFSWTTFRSHRRGGRLRLRRACSVDHSPAGMDVGCVALPGSTEHEKILRGYERKIDLIDMEWRQGKGAPRPSVGVSCEKN